MNHEINISEYKDNESILSQIISTKNSFINFDIETKTNEEKLMLEIYKQRYNNIKRFVDIIGNTPMVFLTEKEKKFLTEYYFKDNGLKEMNIIGTDLYINSKFIKQKIPFLYRCVGKDDNDKTPESIPCSKHMKRIFTLSKEQIETGGKGQLFSYSKCFGVVIYKYTNAMWSKGSITLEVRKKPYINAITIEENKIEMLQEYDSICTKENNEKRFLPYFAIDMSNARDNDVNNLKRWIENYLGKQNWHYGKEIIDPIGDAEVVMNFTNTIKNEDNDFEIMAEKVERKSLKIEEFCKLLYLYFKIFYYKSNNDTKGFDQFVKRSINTMHKEDRDCFNAYICDEQNEQDLKQILKNIDWDLERKYMTRKKGVEGESNMDVPKQRRIYKGENAEWKTTTWKEILDEAIRGNWSHLNYGGNDEA